jgi:hypothetical protein
MVTNGQNSIYSAILSDQKLFNLNKKFFHPTQYLAFKATETKLLKNFKYLIVANKARYKRQKNIKKHSLYSVLNTASSGA